MQIVYLSNAIVLTTAHGHVIIIQRMIIEITMISIISPVDHVWMSVKIKGIYVFRGCQIGMQGPQLCAKPSQKIAIFDDLQFCKSSKRWVVGPKKVILEVATSNLQK